MKIPDAQRDFAYKKLVVGLSKRISNQMEHKQLHRDEVVNEGHPPCTNRPDCTRRVPHSGKAYAQSQDGESPPYLHLPKNQKTSDVADFFFLTCKF